MPQETDACILTDRLMREADWDIEGKANVSTEEATRAPRRRRLRGQAVAPITRRRTRVAARSL
jgi:hypothetical protein